MKSLIQGSLPILLVALVLGCASRGSAPPSPSGVVAVDSKTRQGAFEASVKDLSKKTGTPERDIAGVSQEEVTWPDSCLGCVKAGEMCAQVLTPGYKIFLQVRDATYEYHTNRGKRVRLCDQATRSPAPTPTPGF